MQDHKFYVGYGELPEPIDTVDQVVDILRLCGMMSEADRFAGGNALAMRYAAVCNSYKDALNKMWDTEGEWLDNDMWWFDVADCVIGIAEVRELVDRMVDFDTFYEWYHYDLQISYAIEAGKPVNRINLHTWLNGYPEDKKVPKEQLDKWEREYWDKLQEED